MQVMNKSQELPYNRQDLIRAFKIFSMDDDNDTPAGTIAPDKLERVLVRKWACRGVTRACDMQGLC